MARNGVREIVLLTLGWEDLPKAVSVDGADPELRMREPVPGILLHVDGGWLLLDTSFNTGLMRDAALRRRFYGDPIHRAILPVPGEPLEEALAHAGIELSKVHAVGLSHLHLDHAGGLRHFTGVPVHCQRRELEYGLTVEAERHAIYRIDFDDPTGYPAYYAHMGALNTHGPDVPDLAPARSIDPAELASRLHTGEWVVDLRDRTAYAASHLAGTVAVPFGSQFSTYIGWVIPWGTPITLIAHDPADLVEARRQLVRIGIDHLAGQAAGELAALAHDTPLRSYRRATFADLTATPGAQVLDVRRDDEVRHGRIAGSVHIPLDALAERLHELPRGEVWVHCTSGYRASIAASILDRAGHPVIHVDDAYSNAAAAGLKVLD